MSSTLAEKRVNDFERKYGEVALQLAYHAALPVALNADLLHLLRINFFLDPPTALPYTAEFELLLSPLCREIDEGLYEIEPEIRDILLQGLCSIDNGQQIKDVATLLWQYIDRDAVWIDRVELERAQQLTVLNFLDPAKAGDYLAEGDAEIEAGQIAERDWYVAMRQEIDRYPQPTEVEEIDRPEEMRQDFYREMLERHLDDLKENIEGDFIHHNYKLSFGLHPREIDELNIDEVNIHDVTNVNITNISKSVDTDDLSAVFEVSAEIVFSAEFTTLNHEMFIREIHEDSGYPTTTHYISNQSVNATVRVYAEILDNEEDELEIDHIDLIIQEPILVNYQDEVISSSQTLIPSKLKELIGCEEDIDIRIDVLDILNPRERDIIRLRYGLDDGRMKTLVEIGQIFNVTPERIRQIQAKARTKLCFRGRWKEYVVNSSSLNLEYSEQESPTEILDQDVAYNPKVFISYSHDSQQHMDRVLELADKLRRDGIDATIDQYEEIVPQGWQQWMSDRIEESDFVLVVCTEQYNLRFNGNEKDKKGIGVEWKSSIIVKKLYSSQGRNPKFLPVVLNLKDIQFIPTPLRHIQCGQLYNNDGYKSLYRYLTNQRNLENIELSLISQSSPIIMPTTSTSTPATKTTRSKKQPDADKLRKIQEHISILRNSRSTELEKISALKALGRATDNEQVIQVILFLTRTNKNNDVIDEAVKSLGNIGKKDTSVLQEVIRLLRSSSNNLVIIEALTSLGKIGNTDPTTIRAILHLLALNRNSSVIINIMKTFASIAKGNNEVIQKILSLLPSNNDTNVKKSMIESLGEIASGNKNAINQLISILRFSPNTPIIKQFAANSLGKIAVGDKDAISAMESELKFSSIKAVKDRVAVNLNKIAPGNKAAADYRAKTKKTRSTKK